MRADYRTIDTREKLFAAARAYFMQAAGVCVTENSCVYRLGGRRDSPRTCVVGLFLPDDLWEEETNTTSLHGLLAELNERCGRSHPFVAWLRTHFADLRALQRIHDDPPQLDKCGRSDARGLDHVRRPRSSWSGIMRIDYATINSTAELFAAARAYFEQAPHRCAGPVAGISHTRCFYREHGSADDEHTCVAGVFIPDDLWTFKANEAVLGVGMFMQQEPPKADAFLAWLRVYIEPLRELQKVHDGVEHWRPGGLNVRGWRAFDEQEMRFVGRISRKETPSQETAP